MSSIQDNITNLSYTFSSMINDSWYKRPKSIWTRESAGGVVCRQDDDGIKVALIREIYYDEWVLPKGQVEWHEEAEKAARREIAEEAGIKELTLIKELGTLERLTYEKDQWVKMYMFLYTTEPIQCIPSDYMHPDPPTWVDIYQLDCMYWPDQRELIEQHREEICQLFGT
ncbi:MAG: NUDIX domain-containing protein [Pseudomonadota bacterium]